MESRSAGDFRLFLHAVVAENLERGYVAVDGEIEANSRSSGEHEGAGAGLAGEVRCAVRNLGCVCTRLPEFGDRCGRGGFPSPACCQRLSRSGSQRRSSRSWFLPDSPPSQRQLTDTTTREGLARRNARRCNWNGSDAVFRRLSVRMPRWFPAVANGGIATRPQFPSLAVSGRY